LACGKIVIKWIVMEEFPELIRTNIRKDMKERVK